MLNGKFICKAHSVVFHLFKNNFMNAVARLYKIQRDFNF